MSECQIPPEGWVCSREEGHEGPCAASPDTCCAPHCWSEYGTPCGTCPDMVTIPRKSLQLLYDCADSYDVRIPQDGHDSWVEPIRKALKED